MHDSAGLIVNHLLAALPAAEYGRLAPHLELIVVTTGEQLCPSPTHFAYFPIDCILSMSYVVEGGAMATAWSTGREGMLGLEVSMGLLPHGRRAEVQFGGLALRIGAVPLQEEYRRGGALQLLLLSYVFALITQSSQLAICNQHHILEQRFCRLLRSIFDRLDGDALFVTQTRLGMMMGVRRESITEIAARLKADDIIHYSRGHLRVVRRPVLAARACGCGDIIRDAFARVSVAVVPILRHREARSFDRRIAGGVERRSSIPSADLSY